MKKTLAIVLALVMVLAMIPAMSAHTNEMSYEKTHKELNLSVWNGDDSKKLGEAKLATSVTAEYDFENAAEVPEVETGRWSEKKKMAVVTVDGFDFAAGDVKSVKIDDKELSVDDKAPYKKLIGAHADGIINFPVELTKAGYSDTFLITVVSKKTTVVDGKEVELTTTEYAKVSVTLKNKHAYKGAETAVITNIASTNSKDNSANVDAASAYIVGDKIYVDFVKKDTNADLAELKITFAKANGGAFSEITYVKNPLEKVGSNWVAQTDKLTTIDAKEAKMDNSDHLFYVADKAEDKVIKFVLETKEADWETKAYTVKVRENIQEEDPKGIYFAETTKTIAMGDKYTPVVMGVKTGKPVAAKLATGKGTDAEVIDFVNYDTTVVGTREGVAYITATYTTDVGTPYTSSSMKIVVTLPGESIPAVDPAAEIKYVTCRALNVRAGAGTSYKKVGLIHRGDAVKVVETKNGWSKLDDGTYVCDKYLAK